MWRNKMMILISAWTFALLFAGARQQPFYARCNCKCWRVQRCELLGILPKRTQFLVMVERFFGRRLNSAVSQHGCVHACRLSKPEIFEQHGYARPYCCRSGWVAQPLLREAGDRADANYFERGLKENLV
jgi:hypothetical protein